MPFVVAVRTELPARTLEEFLVCFLVPVTDLAVLNIGAAFWGLIAGLAVSWLLERSDFTTPADATCWVVILPSYSPGGEPC